MRLQRLAGLGQLVVPQGFLLLVMPAYQKIPGLFPAEINLAFEEMARIKQDAVSNLSAEAARVVEALRLETARSAMEKAIEALPAKLTAAKQAQLIDRSIEALG